MLKVHKHEIILIFFLPKSNPYMLLVNFMFTWVLLDGFLNGFSKFLFFIVEICILIWDF
jgi:hypothetical protein